MCHDLRPALMPCGLLDCENDMPACRGRLLSDCPINAGKEGK